MLKKYIGIVILAVLMFQSLPAFAYHDGGRRGDYRRGYGHGDHRWGHGHVVRRLPARHRTIYWSGISYLFGDGLFYRHSPAGYIIVEPPVGAIVPILPDGYTRVTVERTPRYYYEDTYYAVAPKGGYVVVAPPASVPASQLLPVQEKWLDRETKTDSIGAIDSYDIYIPNKNGSFILVTLKKVEKGFIGPQGEFYPEHPTVEQLKTLYGKS